MKTEADKSCEKQHMVIYPIILKAAHQATICSSWMSFSLFILIWFMC